MMEGLCCDNNGSVKNSATKAVQGTEIRKSYFDMNGETFPTEFRRIWRMLSFFCKGKLSWPRMRVTFDEIEANLKVRLEEVDLFSLGNKTTLTV